MSDTLENGTRTDTSHHLCRTYIDLNLSAIGVLDSRIIALDPFIMDKLGWPSVSRGGPRLMMRIACSVSIKRTTHQ